MTNHTPLTAVERDDRDKMILNHGGFGYDWRSTTYGLLDLAVRDYIRLFASDAALAATLERAEKAEAHAKERQHNAVAHLIRAREAEARNADLERRIAAAIEALEPFAKAERICGKFQNAYPIHLTTGFGAYRNQASVCISDLRRAAAVLAKETGRG